MKMVNLFCSDIYSMISLQRTRCPSNSFRPLETGIEYLRNSCTNTVHGTEDECFYEVEVHLKHQRRQYLEHNSKKGGSMKRANRGREKEILQSQKNT